MLHANFQDLRFKNEEEIGQIPFDVKNKYSKYLKFTIFNPRISCYDKIIIFTEVIYKKRYLCGFCKAQA
jgi:hypothetical protein